MDQKKKRKTGLVLEGGGMRGAFTAGALAWLTDHGMQFDYSSGISSGAVYLSSFLMNDKEVPYNMSVHYACEDGNIGLKALLSEGHYVAYERLFTKDLKEKAGMDVRPLKELNPDMEFGCYDLDEGKTVWFGPQDIDDDLVLLRSACALPIASACVNFRGRKLLDGGITKMIPIEKAVEKQCDRILVITTKPADFVRGPASKAVLLMMRIFYRKYPKLREDYKVRHINYYKQMDLIHSLEKEGKCLLIMPTETVSISRFKGDVPNLQKLYDLGYADMEARKEEISRFLNGG